MAGIASRFLLSAAALAIVAGSTTLSPIAGAAPVAVAQSENEAWVRIGNRWRPGQYLNAEGAIGVGRIQPGWESAMWALEPAGDGYVRIRNRWRDQYLNIENGPLVLGAILPGWESAQWTVEPAGDGFVRLRNRWHPEQYLHIENGRLEAGRVEPGWFSAMWTISGI